MWVPPDLVKTDRLTLRSFIVDDAEAQRAAVLESLPALLPWMAWAKEEPTSVEDRRKLLREWAGEWTSGSLFNFAIIRDAALIGGCGLMRRFGPAAFEIGYWIHVDQTGRGYATECSRALTDVAFGDPSIARVFIQTDRANVASAAVAQKLGFALIGEHEQPPEAFGESGVRQVWMMRRDLWPRLSESAD